MDMSKELTKIDIARMLGVQNVNDDKELLSKLNELVGVNVSPTAIHCTAVELIFEKLVVAMNLSSNNCKKTFKIDRN